jgi:penicillin-binding protein 1C
MLNIAFPIDMKVSFSQIVTDKNGKILYSFITKDEKWRMFTELNEISDDLKTAIIFKEDKYFQYHYGINPFAIGRALFNNIIKNKRTSGASTITMQVARLLEARPRTYASKFIEMFRASQLEWTLSKAEILQLYLNLVPYGGNIEGVKSASVLYFNKQPNHLSLGEITALSIIPNRPSSLKIGSNNDLIEKQRNIWLERFKLHQVFNDEQIADALSEPFIAERIHAPKYAPHFSFRMKFAHPNINTIKTTIDYEKQQISENALADYMRTIQGYNIHNAAIIVVDNKNHEVLTYIGSANFFGSEDAGQVDGVRAVRQPGSTLKPLIYGLAFDNGSLTPKTMLTDVPINYSGYSPVNFNQEYNGYVTVETALAQSLNIPAVKALDLVGVDKAVAKLIDCNFKSIAKQKDILGLSLVLGGCGVSLEEMTALYMTFNNEGNYQNLQYLQNYKSDEPKSILSKEGAFMISEILTQLERPDLPSAWRSASNLPEIAWKTGTSYGRKDAWSIGYNDKYTVGVWVGNFSGEGVPELTGASLATPLLFKIFKAIDQRPAKSWLKAPHDLPFRLVCAETGQIPADFCAHKIFDYFLPTISSNVPCQHMQKHYVSENDSISYCMNCLPLAGYKETLSHYHPIEMLAYYDGKNIAYKKLPKHNPFCEKWAKFDAPQIATPTNGSTYYIMKDQPEALVLNCHAANDVVKVFWYVNNQVHQIANKNKSVLFMPKEEGVFKISCSDDKGRNKDIEITIQFI